MHIEQVKRATAEELRQFIHEKICAEPGCYNEPQCGYIYCIQCNFGASERAHPVLVAAKKRLAVLDKKAVRQKGPTDAD